MMTIGDKCSVCQIRTATEEYERPLGSNRYATYYICTDCDDAWDDWAEMRALFHDMTWAMWDVWFQERQQQAMYQVCVRLRAVHVSQDLWSPV